ncbi:unnamed protein product [Blepharisma stoltei]|uniref:Uncharacterized protein n=1 Tax=Blepharisma stoltei TaxID=1481888 RepID=A0AAU9IB02_9CILI|nr:unnamed protein product [Blepharisma stoltei]
MKIIQANLSSDWILKIIMKFWIVSHEYFILRIIRFKFSYFMRFKLFSIYNSIIIFMQKEEFSRNDNAPESPRKLIKSSSSPRIKRKEEELNSIIGSLEGKPTRYHRNRKVTITNSRGKPQKVGFFNWMIGILGCSN